VYLSWRLSADGTQQQSLGFSTGSTTFGLPRINAAAAAARDATVALRHRFPGLEELYDGMAAVIHWCARQCRGSPQPVCIAVSRRSCCRRCSPGVTTTIMRPSPVPPCRSA
jgi:hypothetical protein